jgi:pimeloyl-ACP methyl ester carboxylesterase
MEASYFAPLAEHFADRPVITYDPRGTARNPTGTTPITPEQHAEDIHRVVAAVGGGPVDVFASSGGAVNTLALIAAHPGDVRRVVAHEPPTAALLADRENVLAVVDDMRATYDTEGNGPAMAKFIALVMLDGEVAGDYLERPAPDPAMFGMSAEDDGSRDNPLMRNLGPCNRYEPDFEALGALGDRLVIAAGEDSGQQMAARGGYTIAARLGSEVAIFPKGHGGFLPGDGDPDGFAARLHEVLDGTRG